MWFGNSVRMTLAPIEYPETPTFPQTERNVGDSPSIYFAPGIDFAIHSIN